MDTLISGFHTHSIEMSTSNDQWGTSNVNSQLL
jgi:hypothetical protein